MKKYGQWSAPVRYLVFGALVLASLALLWTVRSVLEPLVIAAFIAYLLNPAVNLLTRRRRLSRRAAVNLVYFITLALLVGLPAVFAPLFINEFTQVDSDTQNLYTQLIAWLKQPHSLPGIPIDLSTLAGQLDQLRTSLLSVDPAQALQLISKTSLTALWVLVIVISVYYLLAKWPELRGRFIGSFPQAVQPELQELYLRLRHIWMGYLRGQLTFMIIVGVTFTVAWLVLGIPGALVLGLLAGLLTIIPDVGPFLAAVVAVGVALLEGSNWSWMPKSSLVVALIVLIVYLVLITLKNFLLRPVIMGRSVHMHEAVTLVAILLATYLWGILGALLIVPALASLIDIGDYLRRRILGLPPFPETEPFVSPGPAEDKPLPPATPKKTVNKKVG